MHDNRQLGLRAAATKYLITRTDIRERQDTFLFGQGSLPNYVSFGEKVGESRDGGDLFKRGTILLDEWREHETRLFVAWSFEVFYQI